MSEIAVSALPEQFRRVAVRAREANTRGNHELVAELTSTILAEFPGCLAVRKLQYEALFAHGSDGRSVGQRAKGILAGIRLRLSYRKSAATGTSLQQADAMLAANPWSREGWRRLATVAAGAALRETAVFAWEALVKLAPEDRDAGLGLVRAWLDLDRYDEAFTAVEALLRRQPEDGEALALLRRASIDQTVAKGKWDSGGSFREKLRD